MVAFGLVAALLTSLLGGTVAFAVFGAAPGFSASTYATGYGASGPAGITFSGATMYAVDPTDGYLYRSVGGVTTQLASIGGQPTAIAVSGGALYITRSGSPADIVRVDPATGQTVGSPIVIPGGFTPSTVAADPSSGDLFVTSDLGYIWRVQAPGTSSPTISYFAAQSGLTPYGITVSAGHWIFVADPITGQVWRFFGPGATSSGAPSQITTIPGARGVAITSDGFLFVDSSDGSVTKTAVPGLSTGSALLALSGGAGGDLSAIGSDGCAYVSQGSAVVRVANADLSCNLGAAVTPLGPPSLTIVQTTTQSPLLGNGDQKFAAALQNVPSPAGMTITFTVTRDTMSTAYPRIADATGYATFSYSPLTAGTDVITATAVVNTVTIRSNSIEVAWLRPVDTAAPTISYLITTGTPGANFSCPNPKLGTLGSIEYCGWYISPPTVHWIVTANGPSGLSPYSCPDFTLLVSSSFTGTAVDCQAKNGDGKLATFKVVLQAVLTEPSIVVASATTADGHPYLAGTPTRQPVTVAFACATDPILGTAGIDSCGPTQTVTASTYAVSGSVLDVAGSHAGTSFGPVVIDTTPPTITAVMTTAIDGHTYVPTTPTTQDVIVSFVCTDNIAVAPDGCPAAVRVTAGPTVTVSATDVAGNTRAFTFDGINIDRSGPTVLAAITPAPDANLNNALTATVIVNATDPSGIRSITYSATGAQTIASTTVSTTASSTAFSVPVALNIVGTTTVTYTATDSLGNPTTGTKTVNILATQPTTLAITSATSAVTATGGDVTILARLANANGDAPLPGETVTVSVGGKSFTGVTDATGLVRGTVVSLTPGTYSIAASYAGQAAYEASGATGSIRVETLATNLSCSTGPVVIGLPLQIAATLTQASTGAPLPGKSILFSVGSLSLVVSPTRTGVSGTQNALTAPLPAGLLTVAVQFTGDGTYAQTSCLIQSGVLTVDGDAVGKITGGGAVNGSGSGGFNVDADASRIKGELQWKTTSGDLHARTMTSVGISSDCRNGSFSGVLDDGRRFYAYVEDNRESGRGADRLLLWVTDAFTPLVIGDGYLTQGNIQIHNDRTDCGKSKGPKKGVIVVFKDTVSAADKTGNLEARHGFSADARFGAALRGFSAQLTDDQIAQLMSDPDVAFISEDRAVAISGATVPLTTKDTIPTGILRIGAATTTTVHQASMVNVAIVDTGISLAHPDLNAVSGTNCVTPGTAATDDNGHGTHVAGTIGAKNNSAGVVGVAAGTKLYGVKVLNSSGSGTWSQVICGLDWLTANAATLNIKVANLSLGGAGANDNNCGNTNADALHKAICRTVAAGVTIVVAAGNGTGDLASQAPAAYPEVLTVTAMSDSDGKSGGAGSAPSCSKTEKDDYHSTTSNYAKTAADAAHVIAGPGVCINSTWLSGGYKVLSGTSMAAPHVTGAVALCLGNGGSAGPCSGLTPAQVVAKIRSDAQALTTSTNGFVGDPTRPNASGYYYGYLVHAERY